MYDDPNHQSMRYCYYYLCWPLIFCGRWPLAEAAVTVNSSDSFDPDDTIPANVVDCNRSRSLRTYRADSHRSGCPRDCTGVDRTDHDRCCSHWARSDDRAVAVAVAILNDLQSFFWELIGLPKTVGKCVLMHAYSMAHYLAYRGNWEGVVVA